MIYPLNLLKLIDFVSLNKFACEMGMFYFMNFIHTLSLCYKNRSDFATSLRKLVLLVSVA